MTTWMTWVPNGTAIHAQWTKWNRAVFRIRMGVHLLGWETFFWKCQQRYYGAQSSFTLHQFFCSIGIRYGQIQMKYCAPTSHKGIHIYSQTRTRTPTVHMTKWMTAFRPLVGPREGRGDVATSDFVPSSRDPRERRATGGYTQVNKALHTCTLWYRGGGGFSMGKFLPAKIPPGKNSATIVKSDGKNCATLFHGEGQGLRSALLIEGDTT